VVGVDAGVQRLPRLLPLPRQDEDQLVGQRHVGDDDALLAPKARVSVGGPCPRLRLPRTEDLSEP
jgi:hypothetical protein